MRNFFLTIYEIYSVIGSSNFRLMLGQASTVATTGWTYTCSYNIVRSGDYSTGNISNKQHSEWRNEPAPSQNIIVAV